ncbi:MAG: hypothetical protein CM15mL7_090 [uncultured marine virus]|nr:MAG: hypothetical protein CM15mL7_090 [uncultured marine virus]
MLMMGGYGIKKNIADALARSMDMLEQNIKKWILDNKMQLWILWDSESKYYGVVVTEIIQRPLKRCLNIKKHDW